MNGFSQDLRYAARQLFRQPALAAVAVVTLALGIGANTAIFSVVRGVLLRPLPYESPQRLAIIRETILSGDTINASYRNFVDWRADARSFSELAALQTTTVTLAGGEGAERVLTALASRELFEVLGVIPSLGRTFRAEEDQPGANPVLLLGHGIWPREFGADTSLVGRSVRVNGEEFTVIGVMPVGFEFPTRGVELWAPLRLISDDLDNRAVHTLLVVGRLERGVDLDAADDEMSSIAARIQEAYPGEDPGHGTAVVSLHEAVVGDVKATLLVLLGAVVFLLLIACTNVADLLLARAMARAREMAVRSALGASRRRLIRQTLVESLLLALIGGACGVALALWGLDVLAALVSTFVPRAETIRIDGAVLAFTLVISLFTGMLFGLWPALRGSRADLVSALRERAGTSTGGRRRRLPYRCSSWRVPV
jgi:predicted permease